MAMSLSPAQSVIAQVRSESRAHHALTARIADYLAAENREDACRVHVLQAEEIIAMVRESDRDLSKGCL